MTTNTPSVLKVIEFPLPDCNASTSSGKLLRTILLVVSTIILLSAAMLSNCDSESIVGLDPNWAALRFAVRILVSEDPDPGSIITSVGSSKRVPIAPLGARVSTLPAKLK